MQVGGLTLRKQCGERLCPEYYVCSDHDLQCYPCLSYCNDTSHNYDAKICELQCQDYIHDYVRHYVKEKDVQEALQELESLKTLIIFMTVLVAIALIFISITLAFIWNREKRIRKIKSNGQDSFFKKKLASLQYLKKRDKVSTVSESISAKMHSTTSLASAVTQTDIITPVSSASSGQRTNTSSSSCSSSKLPCEDATLEFAGYDNFALKTSPVLGKPAELQFTP
ncbi:protein grindelwald [Daktulosphaira vitifoliae]|uniref:protein grindelwald n=1 Tax=Daktulosphaira vitifoliae TaxID=58002 RepID=UPI0021A9D0CD|nr:protein grindelwald [Daktulosphaira vitifoliae]